MSKPSLKVLARFDIEQAIILAIDETPNKLAHYYYLMTQLKINQVRLDKGLTKLLDKKLIRELEMHRARYFELVKW